tara:strand:- start:1960 stop:3606 length:1647 start_codon:yes stop_codon:yes gene_type:complete
MEGTGALFNPGFLGGSFLWWIGQIVDDSTWRDNINPGKYEDRTSIPGWGRRYKVRIIGLHDQGETTIPSDQLPWAQVMYPVTAGGGQTGAMDSTKLRQGNMVFGFFLDGQERQVPIIMGVLGNNSQTILAQKNSTVADTVTDTQPGILAKSGYSEGSSPKSGTAREVPPDDDLSLEQPAEGTVSNESADGIQQTTAADSRRQAKCEEKIALMKPDPKEFISSSLKAIQTVIENLTNRIDTILQSLQSYADAITNNITDAQQAIQNIIQSASREISKFMKPIFDKIQEFALKILNQGFNMIIAALPSSMRFQFKDMVQQLTELLLCMYNKMTGGLKDQIAGSISDAINPQQLLDDVNQAVSNGDPSVGAPTNPRVPMCAAEAIVAKVINLNKEEIDSSNNAIVNNLNAYLEDTNEMLSGITGFQSEITNQIGDIVGSMTGALDFTNFQINIFGCELEPTVAESDIYTFCSGGDQTAPPSKPSSKSVEEGIVNNPDPPSDPPKTVPYLEPQRSQQTVELVQNTNANQAAERRALEQAQDSESNVQVDDDT